MSLISIILFNILITLKLMNSICRNTNAYLNLSNYLRIILKCVLNYKVLLIMCVCVCACVCVSFTGEFT
jgi:hypothetical protein